MSYSYYKSYYQYISDSSDNEFSRKIGEFTQRVDVYINDHRDLSFQ